MYIAQGQMLQTFPLKFKILLFVFCLGFILFAVYCIEMKSVQIFHLANVVMFVRERVIPLSNSHTNKVKK